MQPFRLYSCHFSVVSGYLVHETVAVGGEAVMAMICWNFVLVLLLTLTALVAPCQPLFQPPAEPYHMHARDLETSEAAIDDRTPHYATGGSDVEQSWNALVGPRGRFRRLIQRGNDLVCDQQLNCKKRGKTVSPSLDSDRARTREILANYRLPQVKHMAHLDSDRMVPTGPNPLHNSNRSEVIFP